MDNVDILKEICIKLDLPTLVNLFIALELTSMQVSKITDNTFWYHRAEFLVERQLTERVNANWKQIYWTLVPELRRIRDPRYIGREGEHTLLKDIFHIGLDTGLDLLLVLFELYGEPRQSVHCWRTQIVYKVGDVEVLEYLIKNNYVDYDRRIALFHLHHIRSNTNLIKYVLACINPEPRDRNALLGTLKASVTRLNKFELVYDAIIPEPTREEMEELARYSIKWAHPSVNEFISSKS
ncbi:Hypothetical protein POVR2_LOCUS89 [uncultured virus]|nr:Hypothetical protein POVR2_LOCUS89 [uncultured virus]